MNYIDTVEVSIVSMKYSILFMVKFMDFFDLYYNYHLNKESSKLNPTGLHQIHLIFNNFYHFLNLVRLQVHAEETEPYAFVLDHLEKCLMETDIEEGEKPEFFADSICVFSHRKYAEMYFFYKLYLLKFNKPLPAEYPPLNLEPFEGGRMNTHVRLLLFYTRTYDNILLPYVE